MQNNRPASVAVVTLLSPLLPVFALLLCAQSAYSTQPPSLPLPDQKADTQMKAVLRELAKMNPVPLFKMTPAQARKRPGPPDAVKALLKQQGN